MGGFLGALLDDIVEVARTRALASPGSRLAHPLGLILDEIANMFRWGNLPRIMADGGGRGICTFVVLQALSQAETSWSRAEADTIWAAATAKVLLGGAIHVDHLRDIEALLGTRDTRRTQRSWSTREAGHYTSEQHERRPLMSVDEIRRMPQTARAARLPQPPRRAPRPGRVGRAARRPQPSTSANAPPNANSATCSDTAAAARHEPDPAAEAVSEE